MMTRLGWPPFDPLIKLFSFGEEKSGQRHLFASTSAMFGGRGVPWNGQLGLNSFGKPENGLFLINDKCDCTPNEKVTETLRETALGKIWDHTQEVLREYL